MLDSLGRRPRGRRLAARLGQPVAPTPTPAAPEPVEPVTPADPKPPTPPFDLSERAYAPGPQPAGPLARGLVERLGPAAAAELEGRLGEDADPLMRYRREAPDAAFKAVGLALHLGLPGVEDRTGLRAVMPTDDVHNMDRAPGATGGDVQGADLIDRALREVGAPIAPGQAALDFGCSSGRTVRVLAAVHGDVRWLGCDPNEVAIAWAQRHLDDAAAFFVSPQAPPLPELADGELDLVYAWSIWSHLAEAPARAWLGEMRRVIRPGGHLFLTAQGFQSISYYAAIGHEQAHLWPSLEALYHDGFVFYPIFGEEGDWGVISEEWGQTFLTPEWLAEAVTPAWELVLYRPGAILFNQDLYLLRRAGGAAARA